MVTQIGKNLEEAQYSLSKTISMFAQTQLNWSFQVNLDSQKIILKTL
jgi:hypothetical protein